MSVFQHNNNNNNNFILKKLIKTNGGEIPFQPKSHPLQS